MFVKWPGTSGAPAAMRCSGLARVEQADVARPGLEQGRPRQRLGARGEAGAEQLVAGEAPADQRAQRQRRAAGGGELAVAGHRAGQVEEDHRRTPARRRGPAGRRRRLRGGPAGCRAPGRCGASRPRRPSPSGSPGWWGRGSSPASAKSADAPASVPAEGVARPAAPQQIDEQPLLGEAQRSGVTCKRPSARLVEQPRVEERTHLAARRLCSRSSWRRAKPPCSTRLSSRRSKASTRRSRGGVAEAGGAGAVGDERHPSPGATTRMGRSRADRPRPTTTTVRSSKASRPAACCLTAATSFSPSACGRTSPAALMTLQTPSMPNCLPWTFIDSLTPSVNRIRRLARPEGDLVGVERRCRRSCRAAGRRSRRGMASTSCPVAGPPQAAARRGRR